MINRRLLTSITTFPFIFISPSVARPGPTGEVPPSAPLALVADSFCVFGVVLTMERSEGQLRGQLVSVPHFQTGVTVTDSWYHGLVLALSFSLLVRG